MPGLHKQGLGKPKICSMEQASFKSGFVAIIGKPNAGKSTLMNRILGEPLSITSQKPQTTRYAIKGILNGADHQVIFIDTPGYLKPRYELQEKMSRILLDSLQGVDLVLFITEIKAFPTDYDLELLQILGKVRAPLLAIFNKTDSGEYQPETLLSHLPPRVNESLFVSAKTGENLPLLKERILHYLPFHPPFYDADQLSDLPLRFFAQEIIREAIFHQFEEEIPYASAVLIDQFHEGKDKAVIEASIWVERSSQKPIIIGRGGKNLKAIREYAEAKISEFMQFPAQLHLFVKVKDKWRKDARALKELGF